MDKPPFKAKCNHCGVCCSSSLCQLGEVLFGLIPAPCPALSEAGKCMVIEAEISHGGESFLAESLGIGLGCSMPDEATTEKEIEDFNAECLHILYG